MQTGEDLQGLRKIIDFTWFISLFILTVYFWAKPVKPFETKAWILIIQAFFNYLIERGFYKENLITAGRKPFLHSARLHSTNRFPLF